MAAKGKLRQQTDRAASDSHSERQTAGWVRTRPKAVGKAKSKAKQAVHPGAHHDGQQSESASRQKKKAAVKRPKPAAKNLKSDANLARRVVSREVSLGDWKAIYQFTHAGMRKLETNTILVDQYEHAYGASAGLRCETTSELIDSLKEGLPISAFDTLRSEIDISAASLASTMNITPRTLSRRRKEGRLRPDESERLYRICALFDRTLEMVGGDQEIAKAWFKHPKRALGGKTPLEFSDTEPGAREVEALLGRLEHGVFS